MYQFSQSQLWIFFPILILILLMYQIWENSRNKLRKHSVSKIVIKYTNVVKPWRVKRFWAAGAASGTSNVNARIWIWKKYLLSFIIIFKDWAGKKVTILYSTILIVKSSEIHFYLLTCILLDFVAHESQIEFWKISILKIWQLFFILFVKTHLGVK